MVVAAVPFDEALSLTGTILPNEMVDIVAEVGGRIVRLGFSEGAVVKKGQLLVKLWDADLQARLSKARQQLTVDEDRLRRLKELRNVDGVSIQDFDVATATVGIRKAEIEDLEAQISRTELRAPFDGRVGLRNVSEGAVITPATVVTSLRDERTLKLECSLPERYAAAVAPGMPMQFTVRGRGAVESRTAQVYATDPGMDTRTRTLRVRARVTRTPDLVPGMFADIRFELSDVADALLVPSESVVPDINGASVYVSRNGVARQARVELGGRSATHVRVLSGIAAGDTVITTGLLMIKQGAPIAVTVGS